MKGMRHAITGHSGHSSLCRNMRNTTLIEGLCRNIKNTTLIEDLQNHDPTAIFAVITILIVILFIIVIIIFFIYIFLEYKCIKINKNKIENVINV